MRSKHLTPEDSEALAEAQIYFEPYLAYARLREWQGLPILSYGPWRCAWDAAQKQVCRHCRQPYPIEESKCSYCFVPNPMEYI